MSNILRGKYGLLGIMKREVNFPTYYAKKRSELAIFVEIANVKSKNPNK